MVTKYKISFTVLVGGWTISYDDKGIEKVVFDVMVHVP